MAKITAEFTEEEKKDIRVLTAKSGFKAVRDWVRSEILKVIEADKRINGNK